MTMRSTRFQLGFAFVLAMFFLGTEQARAQAVQGKPAAAGAERAKTGFRKVFPGIEKTIPPDLHNEDASSVHDVLEVLAEKEKVGWKPKLYPESQTLKAAAQGVTFRRTIYCLEFTFKSPRMIWVDVPQASGKMQRKLIWYIVYHLKNTGGQLSPTVQPDGTYKVEPVNEPVLCDPHFVLESMEYKKAYLDRLIPVAVDAIRKREDSNRKLLDSVEIGKTPIAVSTEKEDNSVWGVATWEDVDPRIDYFAIYVQGLSNAYKWVDPAGAYKKGDAPGTGRLMTYKTLVLNFWRPGDEFVEDQREIRFGIPGKVDYEWIYR